jgi:hypothetical protein
MTSTNDVLEYLLAHPGWHYGVDLVKAGLSNRATIYIHLGRLVESGYAEERDSSEAAPPGQNPRLQYRATGKRVPVDADLSPVGA